MKVLGRKINGKTVEGERMKVEKGHVEPVNSSVRKSLPDGPG